MRKAFINALWANQFGLVFLSNLIIERLVKQEIGEISTHPTPSDWIAYVVGFPMFTAIAAVLPLLLLQSHYVHTPTGTAPSWAIAGVLLCGAVVAFWFTWRLVNRHFWRLTRSELIGGITGKVHYPLSSIEKIIVGLPSQMPIPGTGAFVSPALKELYAEKQATSLLLMFQDGALLPLKLRSMTNGSALMDELVDRLQNRVARDYVYSEKEIKLLKSAVPNILIRKS
jgi:hypothetical protein